MGIIRTGKTVEATEKGSGPETTPPRSIWVVPDRYVEGKKEKKNNRTRH